MTSILGFGPRGLFIVTEAGEHWVVDIEDPELKLLGKQVVVEGILAGYDRIRTDWIGEA